MNWVLRSLAIACLCMFLVVQTNGRCSEYEKMFGCKVCHYLRVHVFRLTWFQNPRLNFCLVPSNYYFLTQYTDFTVTIKGPPSLVKLAYCARHNCKNTFQQTQPKSVHSVTYNSVEENLRSFQSSNDHSDLIENASGSFVPRSVSRVMRRFRKSNRNNRFKINIYLYNFQDSRNIPVKKCTEFEKLYGCQVCHYLLVQVFLLLRGFKAKVNFLFSSWQFLFPTDLHLLYSNKVLLDCPQLLSFNRLSPRTSIT